MWRILKKTISKWGDDGAPRLGASLAYYTIFSIAPLILITITIAGFFFKNAEKELLNQIKSLIGDSGSELIGTMIRAAQKPTASIIAASSGIVALLFGACGVFVQLKDAFNLIWKVEKTTKSGWWAFVRRYLLSLPMILGIGFLFLVSLLLSTALTVLGSYFFRGFEGQELLLQVLNFVVLFVFISALFALLFKFLPDTHVPWKNVVWSAPLTAALFVLGKFILGFYFQRAKVADAYGAAGSLVLILLWIYYSSQILLFGAELTYVSAHPDDAKSLEAETKTDGSGVSDVGKAARDSGKDTKR